MVGYLALQSLYISVGNRGTPLTGNLLTAVMFIINSAQITRLL